ncbi:MULTISPECIES: hypothetical protein [unclassified Flavobacterium]|uniref:hypothetical protein n=1 Tax=unclassified Flavobacterium TaxID=196869 RepID=UPI003F90EC36
MSKKLGVWMDHSIAYLMEFTANPFEIKTVESDSIGTINSANTLEAMMKIRNQLLLAYYNKIANELKDYSKIILYGPSSAKMELFDVLSEDERFLKVKIEIKSTDRMTAQEQHIFITDYFSTN